MLTRETLATLIDEVGLSDRKQKILDMAKPSIRMISTPVEDESEIPVGASKLGGLPDMPPGVEYPSHKGKALGFVAQINLADLPDHPERDRLPSSGLLQFFYRGPEDDPQFNAHSETLYHSTDRTSIKRTGIPDSLPKEENIYLYRPCHMTYTVDLALPAPESRPVRYELGFSHAVNHLALDRYWDLSRRKIRDAQNIQLSGHLLGYPYQLQTDVFVEAYSLSQNKAHIKDAYDQPEFLEWGLLAQFEDIPDLMLHDSLTTFTNYFCMRESDLKARKFENCLCVTQYT